MSRDTSPATRGEYRHFLRIPTRWMDNDIYGHVNNVRYVEWALETVPMDVRNTCGLDTLEIDFTGEALHGEAIVAGSRAVGNRPAAFQHGIRSQSTDSELARVQTRWRRLP